MHDSLSRYCTFILVLLSCTVLPCYPQQTFDLLMHAGRIVKNYPDFPERETSITGQLYWNKRLSGNAGWHRYYYYPEVYVSAVYGSLGNTHVLGNIYGLNAGFRFRKELSASLFLTAEAGFGAAYFNRPFDENKNNGNIAIGSRLTALASAHAGLMYAFHPRWALITQGGILHCSNSHIALPNVGINLPVISAGIRYSPSPATMINSAGNEIITDKKPKMNVRIALGRGEQGGSTGPVNGPLYSIYLLSAYIYRHYTPVARWQTGLEAYYNEGTYAYITSQRFYDDRERIRSSSLLYILGHEYIFGNVGFVTQGGLYLYNPFAHDRFELTDGTTKDFLKTWITARLGFHYYVFNAFTTKHRNIFAGWYVKTNFGKADFMELTAGYTF